MKHILVVDDNKANLAIAKQELSKEYQVTPVISGFQALQFLEKRHTDLILLDINMPEMDGKETLKKVKENPLWAKIPIIFLTADSTPETESECLALGADDFIAKPFVPKVMKRRIGRIIELNELRYDLETRLEEKTRQVEKVTLQSIMAIANTIDEKDKYTSGHSTRVAVCAVALAKELGWDETARQNLHYVALLHDIGKIGVPDIILNKPSRLTDSEFEIIKKHPTMGNEILKDIKMIDHVNEGALYHHERYDGTGYPCGLRGEQIPITARIVCIADAYDAMTSSRIYRPKLTHEDVISEFEKGKGTQFDPVFCETFVAMLKNGFRVTEEEATYDSEEQTAAASQQKLQMGLPPDTRLKSGYDSLTGLPDRNSTGDMVDKMFQTGYDGALFVINMDGFSEINDRYGHLFGDMILKTIADILRENTQEHDIVSRIAGDQFVIFYRGLTVPKKAEEKAGVLLRAVPEGLRSILGGALVSVSIGMVIGKGEQVTFAQLYTKADKALYYVKNNGKNASHLYEERQERQVPKEIEADLGELRRILAGAEEEVYGKADGTMPETFQKLGKFVQENVTCDNVKQVQTILFTIEEGEADAVSLAKAMSALETAIMDSREKIHIAAKFSESQYVGFLPDADEEMGKAAAERVVKKFYCINAQKGISLSYVREEMKA